METLPMREVEEFWDADVASLAIEAWRHRLLKQPLEIGDDVNSLLVHALCPKNVTILSRYNSDKHQSIFIIFGRNVTEKVGNQKVFYFSTVPN